MFRSHILKKNIRNLYTIDTDVHTSNSITTTTLNGFTFPTEDGSASQVLSTNGSGVLSFISTISGELINDTTPQLAGNLDLNSFNITGSGNWEGNNFLTVNLMFSSPFRGEGGFNFYIPYFYKIEK